MSDPIDAKYLKTVLDKRDLSGRMQKFRDEQDDKPITDLRDFASSVLDQKFAANLQSNNQPQVPKARVETVYSTSPMTPMKFDAPKGRARGDGANEEAVTTLSVTGSFFHMYVDSVTGDTMLQGGTITGGSDTDTIADIAVIDSGTGLPTQSAGVHMYADITGSGTTADGVLIPGWTQTATSIAYAATVPSNTLPTAASPTGKKVYVDLGVFTADNFFPAAPGSITVTHCPGAYSISR